ncbi:ABC transporter substrate-binding protein [Desulfobacter curvatus]|uniref:ABC transporter substrate-binding protein n=1 Tax=Desulfobacter curvatus TaxID=2290 RepID=UPI0003767EEF|nr:ABC transporter substrate-binding protein [Desulfobacter curvatus]
MAEKPAIKIGYLKITDHFILGVTARKLQQRMETFQHCTLEPVVKNGWNEVADALSVKSLDGALVLAPTAMDLFKSGVDLKLLLLAHKSGSVLVKNKRANINSVEDFAGKTVLIPYQLSIHNMLFHKLLSEKGLKPGRATEKGIDVTLEVVAPFQMPEALEYDEDGEIGGFIVAEPFGSQVIAAGHGEEFELSKNLWPKHPCCVFVMRTEIIEKNPEAIQEICTSFVRSGLAIDAQPEPASIIGADFFSQDKDIIRRVLTDPPDRILTGELYPQKEDLDVIQKYMMDEMNIMTSLIDLDKFVDTRFADAAGAK